MSETPKESKKRGPGRPKKNVEIKTIPRNGVVDEPRVQSVVPDLRRVLEFYYDNPMTIKKIFGLFKQMNSKHVDIHFLTDRMVFLANDFKGDNLIYIEIICDRVNSYYIETPFSVGLDPTKPQQILNKITNDYESITIWFDHKQRDLFMNITLYYSKLNKESTAPIKVSSASSLGEQAGDNNLRLDDVEAKIARESQYPLCFSLESKEFKKIVTDAKTLGPKIRIEKDGDSPMAFITEFDDMSNGYERDEFQNSDKIRLRWSGGDDHFSTSLFLSSLKPLAGALIADVLHISADKTGPLITRACMDNEMEGKDTKKDTETTRVRVLTPVINNKIGGGA